MNAEFECWKESNILSARYFITVMSDILSIQYM